MLVLDLVRPLLYMYRHMKAKIRIPGSNLLTDGYIPIHIGVKQGAVTSPMVYNNATLPAQCQLSSCSIYKNVFWRYVKISDIGLPLNAEKCDVLIFNEIDTTKSDNISIDLNGTSKAKVTQVKPCVKLKYLGLPVGKNLKKTRLLMLESMETKIRHAYGTNC